MRGSNTKIKDKFFYASEDVEYYDETIELTVPYYQLIHQTMIDILNYHFGARNKTAESIDGIILDVGAGTGKESISLLRTFPYLNTLAIDLCKPMKTVFEENYVKQFGATTKKRYSYIVNDITTISNKDVEVQEYYNSKKQNGCKAAISAYCIHHFPLDGKRQVYQKMFDFLEPGGILINVDLFNYESEAVRKYAHDFDIDYINREFDNPSPQFKQSGKIPLKTRRLLKEKWIKHMNNDNILDSIESQISILKEIGFEGVECVLKYWQQGIICAKKP